MNLDTIKSRIAAKLQIRTANQQIKTARKVMQNPAQAALNLPFLNLIQSRSWAISQAGFQKLVSHARSEMSIELADFFELRPETTIRPDGTALIHVHSALVDSCPAIYEKLGIVTRYETIAADIKNVSAKGAKSIVLVVNSPGGTVAGIRETVEVIAASAIPISSFCASLACSAAYHLIAGTKRIIASPSATVGNIGTILSWADDTEFWNAMGIEWKALVNEGADLKSTGHLEPDETQIAFLQESINESGKAFRDHVQKHRPGINAEVFRAGWYSGEKAKALGLTDEIGTLETAASKVSKPQTKEKMSMTQTAPKDDGLTITSAEFDALPPSDKAEFKRLGGKTAAASVVTPPAPVKPNARTIINPPVSKPEMTSSEKPAPELHGLAKAISAHKGESVSHGAPAELTGLARATAAHKAASKGK